MAVGDHKLDVPQTASGKTALEVRPEGLRLRRTDLHAQDLALAIGVDADYDNDCDRDDTTVLRTLM